MASRSNKNRSAVLVVAYATLLAIGCRGTSNLPSGKGESGPFGGVPNPLEWGADDEVPREGTPERVVATWVDTIRQQTGQPSERGFGGRVYFYDRAVDPIMVKGRLVVYAFDEQDRSPTDHKPTRRYVFPADQLALHQSESELGPSYSFWLPWDSVEGASTEVSLIARFEPLTGGSLVVSEPARQRLPGRMQGGSPDAGRTELAANGPEGRSPRPKVGVQTASYAQTTRKAIENRVAPNEDASDEAGVAESEPGDSEPRRRLSTTTIKLSR